MGERTVKVGMVLVVSLVLATACASGSGGEDSAGRGDAATAVARDERPTGDAGAGTGAVSFAVDATGAPPAAVGRAVVSTAEIAVTVDDIAAARERAAAAAQADGGYVHSEQGQFGTAPSATMTLKVPPDRFRSTLAGLGELGRVERLDVATDDVTEQVIDLDSRIASAEVSVARVRSFLDRATNVVEIAGFESELLRRETDLETLRGQRRALDARVDLATIVLTVQPPPPVAAPAAPSNLPAFTEGLGAGWSAFVASARVAAAVLGAVVPFVPVLVAVGAALWWTRRRRRPVTT